MLYFLLEYHIEKAQRIVSAWAHGQPLSMLSLCVMGPRDHVWSHIYTLGDFWQLDPC